MIFKCFRDYIIVSYFLLLKDLRSKMDKTYKDLFDYINTLEIIDTHEHLPSNEEDRDKDIDVLKEYLAHYFNRDLISAGLKMEDYNKIIKEKLPILEKWKLVEPYWEMSRYTGYGRSLDLAVEGIYGIEKIDGSSIEELNSKFLQSLKPGHFKKVLKDKCKIKTSLLNVNVFSKEYDLETERSIYCDKDFFSPVYVVNNLIFPQTFDQVAMVEEESGIRITSFTRWLEVAEVLIDKAYELGAVALKNQLAYIRTLKFDRVSRSQAEDEFNQIFKTKHFPEWYVAPVIAGKAFQDYMFHYILDIANKKNLVVQIHTGIQEGSGNILSNSNPELLSNLFLEYPDVDFDIFHISYPYQNELTVLAKNYPNVYIDMCWAHIVAPSASVNSLIEWIDTVPLNKISAFGGDYLFIDGVYGHQYLARVNVAKALSVKVLEGLFDIDKAKEIARMLFHDNPLKIFKLEGN
ncbi:MAG: amidohydrolase [Actinobacteria bacterium]|nr:MAG: amidohydrolase [Actinomycetota bacterium]